MFRDLAEGLDWTETAVKQDSFFNDLKIKYGLTNVAYLGVNLPARNFRDYFFHATYNDDWIEHYQSRNYVAIDPIVRRGFLGLMPIDWSDVEGFNSDQLKLFGEARDFRVGTKGLTFPLHGLHNETAIFSITAEMPDKEWINFKQSHLREMRIAGDVFHQRVVGRATGVDAFQKPELTLRERECLRWSAEGKTREDIADILGISPRVVKFHLEGARNKLGCLNITHSVTAAILRGII